MPYGDLMYPKKGKKLSLSKIKNSSTKLDEKFAAYKTIESSPMKVEIPQRVRRTPKSLADLLLTDGTSSMEAAQVNTSATILESLNESRDTWNR